MSVDALLKELNELRTRAGNPSLGVLSRRTGIPRSTLFDALNPKRVTVPALRTVTALVEACGGSSDERARLAEAWRLAVLPRPGGLPAAPSGFTGREAELARLDEALGTVTVISGAGGMGKTWLALRWAHSQPGSFPDGGLYLDLRGFDPAAEPTPPADAIGSLLLALGVPAQAIPPQQAAQTGLYRSILSRKRMLILLDNARDTAQVAPLLPGGPHTTVIVTSRHRLPGLVTAHGATSIALGPLSEEESRSLLLQRLGAQRLDADPEGVKAVLKLCGGLPLALSLVAGRAHNTRPLSARATGSTHDTAPLPMRGTGPTHDTPAARGITVHGGIHGSIQAVLDSSLRALGEPARSLFGLLALMPGPDIGLPAATALAGGPIRPLLRELDNAHLVEEYSPGRFRLHDLIRRQAARDLAPDRPALRRLIEHYLERSRLNNRILEPFGPEPSGRAGAKAWFDAEWPCLVASVAAARHHGWDRLALELAGALHLREYQHPGAAEIDRAALELATGLDDRPAIADAHRNLGRTLVLRLEFDTALTHLNTALTLYDDPLQRAVTEHVIAWTWDRRRDPVAAMRHGANSLRLLRTQDHPLWTARVLNAVGWYHSHLNDFDAADRSCRQALKLCRRNGFAELESYVWHSIGVNHFNAGRHRQALTYLNACLDRGRLADSWLIEPTCLLFIGNAHLALGESRAARAAWLKARQILRSQHRWEEVGQAEAKLGLLSRHNAG